MYTLFISTFDKIITIGLLKDGKVLDTNIKESTQNHSVYTMPMIESILNKNEVDVKKLGEIIVVNGPGSFTGVRIGVTIAKTFAYTLNIPIKTITSLLAYAVSLDSNDKKVITISDMKGKYVGYFDRNNKVIEYIYLKNSEFSDYIKDKEKYLVDDNKFDLEKIYKYLLNVESTLSHNVNPIYIKGIDALNGK